MLEATGSSDASSGDALTWLVKRMAIERFFESHLRMPSCLLSCWLRRAVRLASAVRVESVDGVKDQKLNLFLQLERQ